MYSRIVLWICLTSVSVRFLTGMLGRFGAGERGAPELKACPNEFRNSTEMSRLLAKSKGKTKLCPYRQACLPYCELGIPIPFLRSPVAENRIAPRNHSRGSR